MAKFGVQISLNESEYQWVIGALEIMRNIEDEHGRHANSAEIGNLLARLRREKRAS